MKPLNIYNLFPRLFKDITEWISKLDNIVDMGFNAIYINPFHAIGFSGSLYAIKDYYEYNEEFFLKDKPAEEQLKQFLKLCNDKNVLVFMDLVVNHSSIDSVLTKEHKDWYIIDENNNFKNPGAWEDGGWITWGDLASFDFDNSLDKDNLWKYFLDLCKYYLNLGFNGFRCDAAYQVSSDFWKYLITDLKNEFKEIFFLAETLGCTPVQIEALSSCGFDYIFNSSKWWNFNDPWCLEQYDLTRHIAPSISFPETHDTVRLMDEVNENRTIFIQRLFFAALFSKGFMIPAGFEYGFKNKIDTVKTTYKDWEKTGLDFTKEIKSILGIKKSLSPLHEESLIKIIEHKNWINIFCFIKEWKKEHVLICINKDINNSQKLQLNNLNDIVKKNKIKDYSPLKRSNEYITTLDIDLLPGEVKIFASELDYKE